MKPVSWGDIKVGEKFLGLKNGNITYMKINDSHYVDIAKLGRKENNVTYWVDRPFQFQDIKPGQRFKLNNEIHTKIQAILTTTAGLTFNTINSVGSIEYVDNGQCVTPID